jgi:hypothetical protein
MLIRWMIFSALTLVLLPDVGLISAADVALIADDPPLRVGTFVVDVSPPIGSPLAYDPCRGVAMPLTARGIVLVAGERPIVLCAVDWIGIANGGYDEWRKKIAAAAGTTIERVSVHALHQHDAPYCDLSTEQLLAQQGLGGMMFDAPFVHKTIERIAQATRDAVASAQAVTHIGLGQAEVERVASNRRILGPDGKVRGVRYTACSDPDLRAEPEGIIDPVLKSISFFNQDRPIVVFTYYATHPQSYYLTGIANPDFPGIARGLREVTLNGLRHIHFNGAGGNIGAGKYNDGSPENRQQLSVRLADGMAKAWQATEKYPIKAIDVDWRVVAVALPPSRHMDKGKLEAILNDKKATQQQRQSAASDLVWLGRCQAGDKIDLGCLTLGSARVLHLPGELVVEYQLAAQKMRPDLFVAMAAYGEYGPGYICLEEHYQQGGYEDSPRASKVAPEVEGVLMSAMEELLK